MYSGTPISRTLDFSKNPADNSNQNSFPLDSFHGNFSPRYFELPISRNQFSFSLEVREIGIPLYFSCFAASSVFS